MQFFPPEGAYLVILPSGMGFIVCGGLGVVALGWGQKRKVDYLFAAICLIGAIINADLALVNLMADEATALAIDRLTYVFFVFGPAIYLHFVHSFLNIRRPVWLISSAYLMGSIFLAFVFTDSFIAGFNYYSFGRIAKGGIYYRLFTAYCALTVAYAMWRLLSSMGGKTNVERNRIKYVAFGMGLAALLLAFNIVPTYGYDVYPVGSLSFVPAIILATGVLKYDLLDIGAMLRKSLIYTILLVSVAIIYIAIAAIVNATIATFASLKGTVLAPLMSAVVMVAVFDPVKSTVQRFIDHLFYRNRVSYETALEESSGRLATLVKEDEITSFLIEWIKRVFNVEWAKMFIERDGIFRVSNNGEEVNAIYPGHPLVEFLRLENKALHAHQVEKLSLEREKKRQIGEFFASNFCVLAVPVNSHKELIAFFTLSEKKSGEVFLKEEIGLLMTVAHQAAIALENARAIAELKMWNEKLEIEVAQRTKELLQALEEKELAQKQMIRSEALAAIGELVAGTAHELNNPLTSAMSLLQSSLEEIKENCSEEKKELVDDLEFARKELKRAADIVRSLLDVSRQTTNYLEEVNLNHVIEDALRVLHNTIKKMEVKISKDLSADLPKIEGNFAQLGQVFINIIKNALQSLPDGKGEVSLSTRIDPSGRWVIAECTDTGIGVPDELKEQVFKPFFTTKEVGKGTGLGLYICHELLRRHHGTIDIYDRPGGGTKVSVKLPLER